MNNVGRIVFGCISAVIIIAAIILLIPFGLSAENAKKLSDDAFANLTKVSETAKYIQINGEYNTMYFYNSNSLGDTTANTIGRIDFKKAAVDAEGKAIEGAYKSGSVIIGYMNDKWYVIKTATNGAEGDKKYYQTFADKNSALASVKTLCSGQADLFYDLYEKTLENSVKSVVIEPNESYVVTGGSKAIAGAASITIENKTAKCTETLQISNNLIKKATQTVTSEDNKKTSHTYTFKYSGELKMTESLIKGLDELK